MKLIEHIENVVNFNIKDNYLIFKDGNIVNFKQKPLGYYPESRLVFIINNNFIVLNSLNQIISNSAIKNTLKDYRVLLYTSPYLLFYNKKPRYCGVYSTNSNNIIINNERVLGRFIFGDFIIAGDGSDLEIIIRHIPSNKVVCKFELSELGTYISGIEEKPIQVREFSGLFKNTLVCGLNSGGILLLDIQKGEVLRHFKGVNIVRNIKPKEKDSSIYWGLNHFYFVEIDVESNKILRHTDLSEHLKEVFGKYRSINGIVVSSGLIYFKADFNMIGVFDPQIEKVIDFHLVKFTTRKGTILPSKKENFQVHDNKIYALDTSGTLHILEHQKNTLET